MTGGASRRRPWTIMVYMAGDNGRIFDTSSGSKTLMAEMTSAGYRDLWEMGQVGTTDACAVTCLFDTQQAAYLVEVRKGRGMADSLIQPLAEVNTGAPETLADFIVRSVRLYPAERYALVLWNHGTGWLDDDPYTRVRSTSRAPLFHRADASTRPIAFDDTSQDFLDTTDLRRALNTACDATEVRLDLIGMDACLMAMIEGARELAPFADTFVASQEVEPMAGWPYAPVLRRINANPELSGEDLAVAVVDEFAAAYGGVTRSEAVTQSAVSTRRAVHTETLCKTLVHAIISSRSAELRLHVQRARDRTLTFEDRNYRDLGDFAANLAAATAGQGESGVARAAAALRDHLQERGESYPILRVGHSMRYARATGLSVFLPDGLRSVNREGVMQKYRRLTFAQDAGWDFLIEWLG